MTMKIKVSFLSEVDKYIKKYNKTRKRVLYKLGGYVRSTMAKSMRYKKHDNDKSNEGEPPKALKRNPRLRKGIGFVVEDKSSTVVIGPDRWDKRSRSNIAKAGRSLKPLPQLLEEGGVVRMKVLGENDVWTLRNWNANLPGKIVDAVYKPRPFVQNSREKGEQRFLELLKENQIGD